MTARPPPPWVEAAIEAAYLAVRSPSAWDDLLSIVTTGLSADRALLRVSCPGASVRLVGVETDAKLTEALSRITEAGFDRGLLPGAFLYSQALTADALDQLKSPDLTDGIQAVTFRARGPQVASVRLDIFRRCSRRPFTQDDADRCAGLLPHLRRVLGLLPSRPLAGVTSPGLQQLLDRFATPCCLLAADGAVVLANRAAGSLLNRGDGAAGQLSRLLVDRRMGAHRLDGDPPLIATLRPLSGWSGAAVIAYLQPAGLRALPSESLGRLRALADLTQAEAEVAAAVISGAPLRDIAAARGVGRETVKAQLRAIFDKTGTSGQADLIAWRGLVEIL